MDSGNAQGRSLHTLSASWGKEKCVAGSGLRNQESSGQDRGETLGTQRQDAQGISTQGLGARRQSLHCRGAHQVPISSC